MQVDFKLTMPCSLNQRKTKYPEFYLLDGHGSYITNISLSQSKRYETIARTLHTEIEKGELQLRSDVAARLTRNK